MQTRLQDRLEAVNTDGVSLETGEEKAVSTQLASFVPSNGQ